MIAVTVSIIAFLLVLSLVVFVHEFGHFQVARWCGVKVDVFSIGFGPVIAKRTDRHGTEWRLSALPLGGFVKFFGDAGPASSPSEEVVETKEDEGAGDQQGGMTKFPNASEKEMLAAHLTPEEQAVCFHFKPVWQRAAVVAAGPFANFILAIAIFWALFVSFGDRVTPPVITTVVENTAAERAGLQPGDRIVSIDGRQIKAWSDLDKAVKLGSGDNLVFIVDREGELVELIVTPERTEVRDPFGNIMKGGYLGVATNVASERVKYGVVEALPRAVGEVYETIRLTLKFLGRLFLGKEDISQLGGPVKISKYAGQAAMSGFSEGMPEETPLQTRLFQGLIGLIALAGMISVSIGFLNLLPLPVLDGGHLVFYLFEAVAGKPLNPVIQAVSFRIGIVILLGLMVIVTASDIFQLFAKS